MADLSITAASVKASTNASIRQGTSGATITAGQTVYLDSVTNTFKAARANASTTSKVVGIALNGASSGQPIDVCLKDDNFTLGASPAAGVVLLLSGTAAGGIAPSTDAATGDYVSIVGVSKGGGTAKITMSKFGWSEVAKA